MYCYAFVMLYQKDDPLRSSDYFFAKCMLSYYILQEISNNKGDKEGGMRGRGRRAGRGRGWEF